MVKLQTDKKDQETQTVTLATLYIEPGSTHDKLLGGNRQQLVHFVKNPSATGRTIVSNVLLQIGRPPMQEVTGDRTLQLRPPDLGILPSRLRRHNNLHKQLLGPKQLW